MNLSKFTRATPPSSGDGFEQPYREAIIDVLNFCIYADRHVAWAESEAIDRFVETLDWSSSTDISNYMGDSIARVREARASSEARALFFESLRTRLATGAARESALLVSRELLTADGLVTPEETALLEELRQVLA